MPSHSIITLYHPGDVVKVRDDIISSSKRSIGDSVYYSMLGDSSNYAAANDRMAEFAGECVTIEWIENGFSGPKYHIREDGGAWYWTDGMFSGLVDKTDEQIPMPDIDYDSFDWGE